MFLRFFCYEEPDEGLFWSVVHSEKDIVWRRQDLISLQDMSRIERGIVEYFGCTRDEHPCGYCKGTKPALSDYGRCSSALNIFQC